MSITLADILEKARALMGPQAFGVSDLHPSAPADCYGNLERISGRLRPPSSLGLEG